MANEVSIIETVLTAKTDQHDKAIEKSEKKLDDFGKGASDAGIKSWANKVSGTLKDFGTSLTIGLTLPIVGLGKQILDIGFSYEKAMNTFQAVTRASADEMARASAVAEKLGADMSLPATSAADAALAMTELAKGGFTAQQAMDAARGSLQLAAAAQISEAQAATITANALNTFNLTAADSVRVSDLLAAASNASSAEITDIAQAMQQAGSSAANLGVPIEDLVTSIGLMANAGIKGSDAGTSLKTMMAALTPATDKAATALKKLGIDAFDSQGNFVGLETIIQQATPALAGMSAEMRATTAEAAFGSDGIRGFNEVIAKGAGVWNEMAGSVNVAGAAAELAAAKTKGLSGAWDGLVSQLETLGLKVFKSVNGGLESFIRNVAGAVEGLSNLDPHVLKVGVSMAAVAASAGPIALLAGKLMTLGPAGVVTAAVIAGAAAMSAAYTSNFGAMTRVLDDFVAHFTGTLNKNQGSAGAFGTFMSKWGVGVVEVFDLILTGIDHLATSFVNVFRIMKAAVTGNWSEIVSITQKHQSEIEKINEQFRQRHQLRVAELNALEVGGVAAHWRVLRDRASTEASGLGDAIVNGYKQADPFGRIQTFSVGEMQTLTGKLEAIGLKAGLGIGTGLKQGAYNATHQSPFFLIHWLQDAAAYAQNEAPTEFAKAGTKMGEKLKAGFTAALGNINDFLGRAIGGTGSISDSVFDIMLRKFPEAVKELGNQATAFREINKALELYSALMTTASGKNSDFARTVNVAVAQLLLADHQLRQTITPINDLVLAETEFVEITKEMGEAIRKTVGELVTLTLQAPGARLRADFEKLFSSGKALAEWGKVMSEGLAKLRNDIRDIFGEGLGGVIVDLSKAFQFSLTGVKEWATDIQKIMAVLPQSFQNAVGKVLETVNKWVEFGNGVLGVLKKLGFDVPATMGDLIQGMIKKLDFSSILNKVKSFGSSFLSSLKNIFNSSAGILAAGGALFASSFGVGGAGGKALGIGGGALAGAGVGTMILPGVGTAIGAGLGAIFGGIFGGKKSKEQSEAEAKAKEQAALNTQGLINSVNQGIIETLQKGSELLKDLAGFVEVPRKAIQRFINQLGLVLTEFTEMSKGFKTEGIQAGKIVIENLGEGFNFLLTGSQLINAIKDVATITEQNISDFISTTTTILNKWVEAVGQIELQSAKFTGKISEKLKSSFEFLSLVPELIKGFAESKPLDGTILDSVFASIQNIVQRMKALSEMERGLELNKAGSSATIFATIFDSTKSIIEALGLFASYKPLSEGAFSPINGDILRVTEWMNGLVTTTASWSSLADAALANVNKWADGLGRVASSIKAAVSGAGSSAGITQSITSQSGAQFIARQSASSATVPINRTENITVNINLPNGTVISEGGLLQKVDEKVRGILRERDRNSHLASVST